MLEDIVIPAIFLGAIFLIYLNLNHVYKYWSRRGVVQPPTVIGLGNLKDVALMRTNAGLIYDQIYRGYPERDAVGVYNFFTPKLLIRSPELIRRVLVSDFSSFHDNEFYVLEKHDPHFYKDPFVIRGDAWKPARAKLTSVLTSKKIQELFPLMYEVVPHLDAYLDENQGKDVEAKELATFFSMDIVSNVVFGISSNCFSDSEAEFRKMGDLIMKESVHSWWQSFIREHFKPIRDLMGLKFIPKKVEEYVEYIVQEVLELRLKNNVSRNDYFQLFMKKEGNDLKEITSYGIVFFLEGFETSAMSASIALYHLARHPHVQQTLLQEVQAAYDGQGAVDYETIHNLPYLDNILNECSRLYPVAFATVRECSKSTVIEINGQTVDIERGTPVIIPLYSIHRDPLYWPDPEVFDPERFSAENVAARPPNTFMPFGDGPRMCPGVRFAMTQIKLLIAHLVYKYNILSSERTPRNLTLSTAASLLMPNEELWIRLEKRK